MSFLPLQIYDKKELLEKILEIVNKTNMIDYTMDIRQRLNLGESMPEVSLSNHSSKLSYSYSNKLYFCFRNFHNENQKF